MDNKQCQYVSKEISFYGRLGLEEEEGRREVRTP